MKLGVSSLFLKPTQVGGAEYMLGGLLLGMAQIPGVQVYAFINQDLKWWFSNLKLEEKLTLVPVSIIGNRFINEAFQLPHIAHKLSLDGLIYPNYFIPCRLLRSIPIATVIHDLNYIHFPNLFSWQRKLWLRFSHQIALAYAEPIVTVSEFVLSDLLNSYYLKPQRSPVSISNPILWQRFDSEIVPSYPIHRPFILSVANHYQHKNLATLLKAFQRLPKALNDFQLVLVGQLPESLLGMRRDRCDDIPALVKELNLQDRVTVTGHISDAELAWYYHHAEMFAFPSIFEGFGMPPVEALGMGLPTLTTRCTAIPEATLNLAQYVNDPFNAEEWCDRIVEILRDRNAFVPTQDAINRVRATYDPVAIANKYVNLFRIES